MTIVLLPLMVVPVVFVLLALLLWVAQLGPLGWALDVVLVVVLVVGTRQGWRSLRRWWASTKAPERPRRDAY